MTVVVRTLPVAVTTGTLTLFGGDGLHLFSADGTQDIPLPLSVDFAAPTGPFSQILTADVTFRIRAHVPVDGTMLELTYTKDGEERARDEVHLSVIERTITGGFTRGSVRYSKAMMIDGSSLVFREFGGNRPITVLLPVTDIDRQHDYYRYLRYRKNPKETGYVQAWQEGWLLDAAYFIGLAESWNALLDALHLPFPFLRYDAAAIIAQFSAATGISEDILNAGRYFVTGQIADTGLYDVMLLNRDLDETTASRVTFRVIHPGELHGSFRVIGDQNAPYFHEESMTEVNDTGNPFLRILGGMRIKLMPAFSTLFTPYTPDILDYTWSIARTGNYVYSEEILNALLAELRDKQSVPQKILDQVSLVLKGKTFETRDEVKQVVQPAFQGFTMTQSVVAQHQQQFNNQGIYPSYFWGEADGKICKNADGLCALKDGNYSTWDAVIAAARAACAKTDGGQCVKYALSGYRLSRQALHDVRADAALPDSMNIYVLLAGNNEQAICKGCLRGTGGEGYSFRNADAAEAFSTALKNAMGEE